LSRLTPAFLLMIFSCSVIFVNPATAAIDDDLPLAYNIDDAKWFLAHKETFKVVSTDDWLNHDQEALKYAYQMNLTEDQIKNDTIYTSFAMRSLNDRSWSIKKNMPRLLQHNIARAKKEESEFISTYKQSNAYNKKPDKLFIDEILRHKSEWIGDRALYLALHSYEKLTKIKHWSIDSCRRLKSEFPAMRRHVLAQYKYALWEKKHNFFYHDDFTEIHQVSMLNEIKKSLNHYSKTLRDSGIDQPQLYMEMAALHESDWHECRRTLEIEMPKMYRQLSSSLEDMKRKIYSARILDMERKDASRTDEEERADLMRLARELRKAMH